MNRAVFTLLFLTACGAIAIAATTATGRTEGNQSELSSMLSQHLKKGQNVRLQQALSGGYDINVLSASYLDAFKRDDAEYLPQTVVDVRPGFVVVDVGRGIKKSIAAHAIDEITRLPNVQNAGRNKNGSTYPVPGSD